MNPTLEGDTNEKWFMEETKKNIFHCLGSFNPYKCEDEECEGKVEWGHLYLHDSLKKNQNNRAWVWCIGYEKSSPPELILMKVEEVDHSDIIMIDSDYMVCYWRVYIQPNPHFLGWGDNFRNVTGPALICRVHPVTGKILHNNITQFETFEQLVKKQRFREKLFEVVHEELITIVDEEEDKIRKQKDSNQQE